MTSATSAADREDRRGKLGDDEHGKTICQTRRADAAKWHGARALTTSQSFCVRSGDRALAKTSRLIATRRIHETTEHRPPKKSSQS